MKFEKIITKAEDARDEVAELCSKLVQIKSSHPEGRTDQCVAYIKEYLDGYGIKNEVHSNDPLKPNIVAKIKGTADRKILWVGHLDVVPEGKPESWTHPPYSGKITEDGRVYGRGSSDMKGACAAAMVSARILEELGTIENSVEFWFTSDEEIGGGEGARWLSKTKKLQGDVCLIGDGNGGGMELPSIDMGCKGGTPTTLIAHGITAHGATPFLGENAIKRLIEGIPWVEKIGEHRLELPLELEDPIKASLSFYKSSWELDTDRKREAAERAFHYPTVTCNIINGGVKRNVVPDYAEATFDIRLTPGSSPLTVKKRIEELVRESGIPGLEVQVQAQETAGYYEPPDTSFAHQLSQTIAKVTGREPIFTILTGGTDAISIKNHAGIPCLGYGTSLSGMAHQPDEYITIDNLVLGVKIYAGFATLYRG